MNNADIVTALPGRVAAIAGGMVNMTRGIGTALGVAIVTLGLHGATLGGGTSGNGASGGGVTGADGLAEGIARLRRALRRGARVADPGNALAVAQLELLGAVTEHPGARPSQLARLLNMRPNTVTTIVNALSARGMVSRVTADDDKRAVELTVTEAGQQAVLAWHATNATVIHLALSALPHRQRRVLAAAVPALNDLAREIDRLADTPGGALDPGPDSAR